VSRSCDWCGVSVQREQSRICHECARDYLAFVEIIHGEEVTP
jgi:hypothetical protein